MAKDTEQLTGAQKAAMLLMALDEEQAAAVLTHMSDSSVGKLCKAAESLDVSRIGDEQKRETLRGFLIRQRTGGFFLGDPDERFRRMLARAKGEETLRQLYEEPAEDAALAVAQAPLDFIEGTPEEQVASMLEKESPRSAAVLLARLSGQKAGHVLNMLDEELRKAIVERIVWGENVPPEIAEEVIGGFRDRLEELGLEAEMASEERRSEDLASMISTLDKESQEGVLSQIHERAPELAEMVERCMFGFEDLVKVESKSMQQLLRNVDVAQIALALKGAPEEIKEHVYTNISQRAKDRVEEEREMTGRVPLSQVEEAREELMKIARQMYREGELVVEIGEEQYVE